MKSFTLNTTVGPLAANLYLPENKENPPVVIVTGAWTTVKEQMPAVYAKVLADLGFATLTFDFRGWGKSPDSVKYLEDPVRKTEDIKAVIDALADRDDVDGSKISVWACARPRAICLMRPLATIEYWPSPQWLPGFITPNWLMRFMVVQKAFKI